MRRQTDVWVKFDQTKNRRVSERIELQQWHIDCPSRTVSLTASVRYADDNSVISNETFSDDEQRAVPPDTIADEIVSLICEALEAMPD